MRSLVHKDLPVDTGDFRLISRNCLDGLRKMRETHRFLRGMVAWVGFRTAILPYTPAARMGGTSKYSFKKMTRLAIDAVYSFSLAPIFAVMAAGMVFLLAAVAAGVVGLAQLNHAPTWNPLLVFLLLLCTGVLLVALDANGIVLRSGLRHALLEGPMRIVAVCAHHQTFVDFVVEGFGKRGLHIFVAAVAKRGLRSLEQICLLSRLVYAVAIDAADFCFAVG